jgi:hypothetical protein
MGRAWLYSSVLHVALAALLYFGLPSLSRPPPAMEQAITVELVNEVPDAEAKPPKPAPAATAPEPEQRAASPAPNPTPPPPEPKVEPKPAPEPQQAELPPEPEPTPPPEPEVQPAPEPEPVPPPEVAKAEPPPAPEPPAEPEVQPEPAPAPEPEVAAVEPPPPPEVQPEPDIAALEPAPEPPLAPEPQPEPQPVAKPEPPPPPPAPPAPKPQLKPTPPKTAETAPPKPAPPPEDAFAALLKSVEQLDRRTQSDTTQAGQGRSSAPTEGQVRSALGEARLSVGEIDALRRQIEGCWTVPVGVVGIEDMEVQLRIQVRPDRTVQNVTIEDQSRLVRDPTFRAVAESARRAVEKCDRLDLPPGKYAVWRDIHPTFRPPT